MRLTLGQEIFFLSLSYKALERPLGSLYRETDFTNQRFVEAMFRRLYTDPPLEIKFLETARNTKSFFRTINNVLKNSKES